MTATAPDLVTGPVLHWYAEHARDLPWRDPGVSPWGVLVSEVMLQQTPVARVVPVWHAWLDRWPTPADLAADSPGEAVRAWGRLGYPRRALRLHQAACAVVERHDGALPTDHADLLALPGVGEYTAAAVASFAFRQRHVVLDTNVRRVLARSVGGQELPAPAITRAERDRAAALLPDVPEVAATWSVAVMELGALVCTAATPRCGACPLAACCAWLLAGSPAYEGPVRPAQRYAGTDRQCRGRLLGVVREDRGPVHRSRLEAVWERGDQLDRCLASLVDDGLVVASGPDSFGLPEGLPSAPTGTPGA
jgi:A/G-specific adenine glycosylase